MVNSKVKPCSAQLCNSVPWEYQQKVPTISLLKGNFPFSPYRSLHPTPTPGQQPAIGIFIKPDLIIYIQKFSYTKYHGFQCQDSWSPTPLNFSSVNIRTELQDS